MPDRPPARHSTRPPCWPLGSWPVDWDLRTCARKGHVTYAVDEPQLRSRARGDDSARRRLALPALRDLRPRAAAGPRTGRMPRPSCCAAPPCGRRSSCGCSRSSAGSAARSSSLLGIAVLRFKSTEVSLKQLFDRDLSSLQPFFDQIHFNVSDSGHDQGDPACPRCPAVDPDLSRGRRCSVYGALQLAEGVGLWSLKRWGEYVAVVGTTLFIPLEVYELTEKVTWLRLVTFAGQRRRGRLPAGVQAPVRHPRRHRGPRGRLHAARCSRSRSRHAPSALRPTGIAATGAVARSARATSRAIR